MLRELDKRRTKQPTDHCECSLAYAEMRLIFARLLWTYDIELMPESENWNDQKIFALWEKKELKVKLTKRVGLPEQTA